MFKNSNELKNFKGSRTRRFLVITPAYWPGIRYGGPVHSMRNLVKGIHEEGLNLTVFTTTLYQENHTKKIGVIDGVNVHYFPIIPFPGWPGFSYQLAHAINKEIENFDLVIISSTWEFPCFAGMKIAYTKRIPYIFIPRGMLQRITFGKKYWKKYPYYKIFLEKYINSASTIVFTTEREREETEKIIKINTKKVIIPNGIDTSVFKTSPSNNNIYHLFPELRGKFLILFMGRFVWKKGLDILITAFAQLSKEFPQVHLVLAGDGETGYKHKILKWIKNYKLQNKVTFTGFLSGNKKLSMLSISDVLAMPSYSENFGMVAVEAMAAGVPVLTTNRVGIYKEVERERAGFVVTPDPESIYYGLKKLLIEPDLRKLLSQRGRSLVLKYFDIKIVAKRYIKLFEEILS